MDDNTQKSKVFIVVILAIIVPLAFYIFDSVNQKKASDTKIVTNYNDFYTVDSCIYRFMSYLNSKNEDNLNLVITDSYKKKNGISSLYDTIPENCEFSSRKMYYEELDKNITKYYVQGYAVSNNYYDSFDEYYKNKKDLYFLVYLNTANNTFSIEPYSGDIFIEGVLDE